VTYSFAQPWFLLVALLAVVAWWWSHRGAGRIVFSSLRALPAGGTTWRTKLAWLPDAMFALAVLALAIALAGPRGGDRNHEIRREGIAIVMAVDVSGSMRALDLSDGKHDLTRLDAVKGVFGKFVNARKDDAIGLVAFARYADTRSPPTLDHANLSAAADRLDFAREDEDGTALGAGLELAVQRLADLDHGRNDKKIKSKVVVLLTDGVSNVHDIDEDTAIEDAIKAGVKVYTIGAGANGMARIRVDRGDGRTEEVQMPVEIDEALLRKIADRTRGQYWRATDHDRLADIYKQIDQLERVELGGTQFLDYHQYYGWFVSIAMALVVLAFALRGTVLRRLP
jgi:Ca-activated chloride channel family protein